MNYLSQKTVRGITILRQGSGFTIVELLVVIVVIAILAAVTIVSYGNISGRAMSATMESDLNNAAKVLKMFGVDYDTYPQTIDCSVADSSTNKCVKSSGDTIYQ